MEISEVEEMLGSLRLLGLLAPQHVFITDEPIYRQSDGKVFYRGLSPKGERGIIILSAQADVTTTPHEWVHSLGLGELVAYPLANLLALRYRLIQRIGILRFGFFNVEYREAYDVPREYKGKIRHYVRVA